MIPSGKQISNTIVSWLKVSIQFSAQFSSDEWKWRQC